MLAKQNENRKPLRFSLMGAVGNVASCQQTKMQRGWLTRFWPSVGARVPLQTNKICVVGLLRPLPPKMFTKRVVLLNPLSLSLRFLGVVLMMGWQCFENNHAGCKILEQPLRPQQVFFQIFVARCRCPWHDEPNPTVQAGHLFRFSLIRNIAWEHYFVQMSVLNVLGYACITAAINVLTGGYSNCVWLILSLSNLIYFTLLTTWGQFFLQTLLWSKCGSRCRDWWRFWSCLELVGS